MLDYGLMEERRSLSRANWTASVSSTFISRHLLEGFFQQRAVSQCSSSCIYLGLLLLSLFPFAFSGSAIALDVVALGRKVFWFRTAVESED